MASVGTSRSEHPRTNCPLDYQSLENRQLLAGDVVVEWNEVLLDAIRASGTAPPAGARAMAIVHTAIHDAVSSIRHEYDPYFALVPAHPKASLEAAVASAAERTLSNLFPALQATFAAQLTLTLAGVADGIREDQGVAVGRQAADQILAWRALDGSTSVVNYVAGSDPGDWRPTPPGFLPPALPQWPNVSTWAMTSGSQFRAPPIPALDSAEYAAAVNEVQLLGSATSLARTATQTAIAKIWAGGPGTATPPGQWNMIAQDISDSKGLTLVQNARLFALLNIALADAAISAWETKYVYNFWRPIAAITEADTDGNAATIQDGAWTPLLTTPPFPAYTSGHSTFSGAGSTVLKNFLGTDLINFVLVSEVPGISDRSFTSLTVAAEEAGMSRIYGGIHFSFDNLQGLVSGRNIGNLVSTSKLGIATRSIAIQDGDRLFIHGTNFADKLFINRVGQSLVVTQQGHEIGRFDRHSIMHIVTNGGNGDDRIDFSGDVNATAEIFGGIGNDKIFGTRAGNWIYGEAGDDVLCGGAGDDLMRGGSGNDFLYGLAGADQLFADDGLDVLCGGSGDDTLTGKRFIDKLNGNGGRNRIIWI